MTLATAVLLAFASMRVTRFIVKDSLFGGLRERLLNWCFVLNSHGEMIYRPWPNHRRPRPVAGSDRIRFDPGVSRWRTLLRGKFGDLIECPFCTGWWVSLGFTCVWLRRWPWELGVRGWVIAWAVAGGQAMLNVWAERD